MGSLPSLLLEAQQEARSPSVRVGGRWGGGPIPLYLPSLCFSGLGMVPAPQPQVAIANSRSTLRHERAFLAGCASLAP